MNLVIGVLDTADWEGARPEDIRQVCLSAAHCFDAAIAETDVEPIRVEPSTLGNPYVSFKRQATGQVRIMLTARGRAWAQFAYQFAHEFCHTLVNFRPPLQHSTTWIEESLCELSSLFALRAMARRWSEAPPFRAWASYAPDLHAYAEQILADPAHQLPAGETFGGWLTRSLPSFEQNGYRRDDNTIVALQLLPLFEERPETWRAVRYLNLWSTKENTPFDRYFDVWRSVTHERHHTSVDRIEARLRQP